MRQVTHQDYSLKTIFWGLVGLVTLCGSMKATGGAGFVLIFIPVLAAFAKTRTALLAFVLLATAFLTMTNSFIAPKDMIYSVTARLVYILVAGIMILQNTGRKTAPILLPILSLLFYVVYQALISSVGWAPIISYLKLTLFLFIFLAFFGMANAACNRNEVNPATLRNILLIFAIFFIVGSLLLIPFPSISQLGLLRAGQMGVPVDINAASGTSLFTGMALHSQAFGPLIAILAVFLFADMLFSLKRWDKLYIFLLCCTPVLIFYTSSRTAMGTFLAGIFFTTFLFMNLRGMNSRWKMRALNALFLFGILGGIILFTTPQMRSAIADFVLKWGDSSEVEFSYEAITATRQGLMDAAMENFAESPWIGNGFQVSDRMEGFEAQSWKQLLTAPVEKGVWITAVLEEGGVFGMLIFIIFLLIAFIGLLKRKAYIGAALLFTFLTSNLGEFTFFSMSGNGGIMWAMVFTGIAVDLQRLRQQRMQRLVPYQAMYMQAPPPYQQQRPL